MTTHDWVEVLLVALNGVIGLGLFIGRLQVKNWFLEQKEATQAALDAHNDDPGAHSNHQSVVDLQEKFDAMISKMGELTTQLAVLNERLQNRQQRDY